MGFPINGKHYPRDWESVNSHLQRLKVPGGWLVNKSNTLIIGVKEAVACESMIFFPDPDFEWVLEK